MKFSRRLALVGAVLTLAAPAVRAQTPPAAGKGQPQLSAAQKSKMEARAAKMRQSVDALKADATLSDAQKQQKYAALNKQFQADMLTYLTPAQRAALKKQAATVQQKQQAFAKAHKAEIDSMQATAKRLDASLTNSQKQQMQGIQQDVVTRRQAILGDASLNENAKKQQLLALSKSAQDKVMAVLNAKQKVDMSKIMATQKTLALAAQKP